VLLQLGSEDQADAVREHLDGAPDLALEVAGVRTYDRGVLVHLVRTPDVA